MRRERVTSLATASAPAGSAMIGGRLVVAASDLETQAAALWFVDEAGPGDPIPLGLDAVAGVAGLAGGLLVTGSDQSGERQYVVAFEAGAVAAPIRLPSGDELAREPRPLVLSSGVLILWEEYEADGLVLAAQRLTRTEGPWRAEGPAVRGPRRPFAPATDAAPLGERLGAIRVQENGEATVEVLDERLAVRGSARLPDTPSRVALATGPDRLVVVTASGPGQPVVVRRFDAEPREVADQISLPLRDRRAAVDAVTVGLGGAGRLAMITHVETVLDDPTAQDRAGGELGPPPRQRTDMATLVDLESGETTASVKLDPASYGPGAVTWHGDRVHVVHGSSPVSVTSFSLG